MLDLDPRTLWSDSMATTAVEQHLFTVQDFHRMAEVGILAPDARVELIEGTLYEMAAISTEHAWQVRRLTRLFSARFAAVALVDVQNPLRLSEISEPQPDLCLLEPPEERYLDRTPDARDVLLLVEVAVRSLPFDRDVKIPLYARSGVPEVWGIDVPKGVVQVYREPVDGEYRLQRRVGRGEELTLAAFPGSTLGADEILAAR